MLLSQGPGGSEPQPQAFLRVEGSVSAPPLMVGNHGQATLPGFIKISQQWQMAAVKKFFSLCQWCILYSMLPGLERTRLDPWLAKYFPNTAFPTCLKLEVQYSVLSVNQYPNKHLSIFCSHSCSCNCSHRALAIWPGAKRVEFLHPKPIPGLRADQPSLLCSLVKVCSCHCSSTRLQWMDLDLRRQYINL